MTSPQTRQPVLAARELEIIAKAKMSKPSWSKTGEIAGRAVLLKSLSKMIMVHSINFFNSSREARIYDFPRTMSEQERSVILKEIYQKLCVNMLADKADLKLEDRVMKFGSDWFRTFYSEYILETCLKDLGGTPSDGIDLVDVLFKNCEKDENGVWIFDEWEGSEIKDNAADTIREYNLYENAFQNNYLDPNLNYQPFSGKTWEITLKEFLVDLHDDKPVSVAENDGEDDVEQTLEQRTQQSHSSMQSCRKKLKLITSTTTSTSMGRPPSYSQKDWLSDPLEKSEGYSGSKFDRNLRGWLPGKYHAWLLFVLYGAFGRAKFESVPPDCLKFQPTIDGDEKKVGHRVNINRPSSLSSEDEENEEDASAQSSASSSNWSSSSFANEFFTREAISRMERDKERHRLALINNLKTQKESRREDIEMLKMLLMPSPDASYLGDVVSKMTALANEAFTLSAEIDRLVQADSERRTNRLRMSDKRNSLQNGLVVTPVLTAHAMMNEAQGI